MDIHYFQGKGDRMDSQASEEIRRHFDFVADGLRADIRSVASETAGLRAEIRSVAERGEEIKRSLGALSENLRTDIRTVAEGFVLTNERLDRFESRVSEEFAEMKAMMRLSFGELDRRISTR